MHSLERSIHGKTDLDPTVLHEDNQDAMKWAQDPANHKKTRHINIAYHSIHEQVSKFKNLAVKFAALVSIFFDAFTKLLLLLAFKNLFEGLYSLDKI